MPDPDLQRSRYESLTRSVRRLIDVTIRSDADLEAVARANRLVDEAVAELSTQLNPGSFGVRTSPDGDNLAWGNVVMGLRNAIAPPVEVITDPTGRAHADVVLGAAYEGPPGLVHGGVCALLLDHVLSAVAHRPDQPAVTGTLSVRFLRPTRLGGLRVEAWTDRHDGAKTFAQGHIVDPDGTPTVVAEAVFIRPRTAG
ncbi:PaaI family thioesterase [Mycobacterium koreense]|uniref:Acyl-coenzyme A thioesterase THEM4 n=1 Tax=Mycolicibacillus koreensis TaxID=1069220 RepID=A0A7I7SHI4_9MYCO|nr:PaaI family thioesterase [Mycolicibacillus koreensis]MCV7247229.1 PaaI family thioesterase [Mycolicibacillus koreensis]ODR06733.1 thioesterase [Mycolicibacillus koreensis]OSC34266.1 thioesterase [Mycolicibacillus koreensis]BBY56417.1 thioesterase [Mycolicibacillus koreensis]